MRASKHQFIRNTPPPPSASVRDESQADSQDDHDEWSPNDGVDDEVLFMFLQGNANVCAVFEDPARFPKSAARATSARLEQEREEFRQSVVLGSELPSQVIDNLPEGTAVAFVSSGGWINVSDRPTQKLVKSVLDSSGWGLGLLDPPQGGSETFPVTVLVHPGGIEGVSSDLTLSRDQVNYCLFLRWEGAANWSTRVGVDNGLTMNVLVHYPSGWEFHEFRHEVGVDARQLGDADRGRFGRVTERGTLDDSSEHDSRSEGFATAEAASRRALGPGVVHRAPGVG